MIFPYLCNDLQRFIVISLLITFIGIETPMHEVLKFPVLVSHYLEHKQKDEHMDLFKFLKMHYAQKQVKDDDYDKDMQLPFKDCSAPIFFTMTPLAKNVQLQLHIPAPESRNLFTVTSDAFLSAEFHNKIWQPPRAC